MAIELTEFREVIGARFHGELGSGSHSPDGAACALEAYSQAMGLEWTDNPSILRIWDVRPINDIDVPAKLRAERMPPLIVAYQGCMDWPAQRKNRTIMRIVIGTVNRIIADLPGLQVEIAALCRSARTLHEAEAAAESAAESASAREAAWAAASAARASAARAAAAAEAWEAEAAAAEAARGFWSILADKLCELLAGADDLEHADCEYYEDDD